MRMDIQIFDATDDDCVGRGTASTRTVTSTGRWETESWIRNQCRAISSTSPPPEGRRSDPSTSGTSWVSLPGAVRGGFSGAQRVYEYTIAWDEDGRSSCPSSRPHPTWELEIDPTHRTSRPFLERTQSLA